MDLKKIDDIYFFYLFTKSLIKNLTFILIIPVGGVGK